MGDRRDYKRTIVPFKDYFKEFKRTLSKDVLMKIYQVFIYIMSEDIIPVKFLKKIEGVKDLYEIRIEHNGNIYRIFCCFDEGNLVILFNAFQKKTQKTPTSEIERAIRIKEEYFAAKASLNNVK
ncbi:MAG: type II toxin-antitoxin system RelE/ParE family toxin [Prevotella sp.]|jgi:phage-related protein|nr:type II toxin-antitoxin system RelE/ParE family toxin [Prevotella sp.]MBQ4449796.1 type II toxin-antitoxin system RelE/ParE family toxin [Prevotella sp.]